MISGARVQIPPSPPKTRRRFRRLVSLSAYPESYRSGHNGAVLKTVRRRRHRGSNPLLSAIKETSFVYQDKRGFFLLSGQNTGRIIEKRALERSIGYSEACFLRSAAKEYRNRCCTNRISLLCKQLLNVFRR